MANKLRSDQGSMLVLTSFVLLCVAVLCLSYWMLMETETRALTLKKYQLRTYFAAKSGLADAMSEIRDNIAWNQSALPSQWQFQSGNTFYKSSTVSNSLTHFDYPVTISVTVLGDPNEEIVTVSSKAESAASDLDQQFSHVIVARVVKSVTGEVSVVSLGEEE